MKLLAWALVVFASITAVAQDAASHAPVMPKNNFKIEDFAFMTGRWIGHLKDGNTAEQICSTIRNGDMGCVFRLNDAKGWVMYEVYSLRQTPSGVLLIGRAMDADLKSPKNDKPMLLFPTEVSKKRVVFAGEEGGPVKTSSLELISKDKTHGHIVHSGGTVDVDWEKVPYDKEVK
jgi:hypothetical protein